MEHSILYFIQENLRFDWLTPIMKAITFLGDAGWFFIVCCLILLIIPKTRRIGMYMTFVMLLQVLLNNGILKPVIHRTRPYDLYPDLITLIGREVDFSFPSGHTGAAFATAFPLWAGLPEGKKRYGVAMILLAACVALSRLYFAVHYPTDVLGGVLLAAICTVIVFKTPLRQAADRLTDRTLKKKEA